MKRIVLPEERPEPGYFMDVMRTDEDIHMVLPEASSSTIMGCKDVFVFDVAGMFDVYYNDILDDYSVVDNRVKARQDLHYQEYSLCFKAPHLHTLRRYSVEEPSHISKTIHKCWVMLCLGGFFNTLFRGGV